MSQLARGAASSVGKADLRRAMSHYPTGVVVVATVDACGRPVGFTCNSFCSVSLNPPLVSFCLRKESRLLEHFERAGGFTVNMLSRQQEALSALFASRDVERKFEGIDWRSGRMGYPLLDGALVTFECDKHDCVDAGDHVIFLGEVKGLLEEDEGYQADALMFYRGVYASIEAANQ